MSETVSSEMTRPLKGLVVSAAPSFLESAYSHRLNMLAESLVQHNISCDFFHYPEHFLTHKYTTASLFMPFNLPMLRRYDFYYAGAEEAGSSLFFCKPFLTGPVIYDAHSDVVRQAAHAREVATNGAVTTAPFMVRLKDSMAFRTADHVMTVSTPYREDLIQKGLAPQNITLIRNGVDLSLFSEQPWSSSKHFTFAYAGAFQSWQGTDELIEAFAHINQPGVRFVIIGFGPQDEHYKQRFAQHLGERATLVDRVDRATMIQHLSAAHVLVNPLPMHSFTPYCFPTKFAEYAALGRPVLVTDGVESADFVRANDCGFITNSDADALAQGMLNAMQTPMESLQAMGARARAMASEHFSWELIGGQYSRLVRALAR